MTERDRLNRRLALVRNAGMASALFFASVSIWRDLHDGWLLCADLAFALIGVIAVAYLGRPLPAPDPEKAKRHLRSMPDPYLEKAMRQAVERLAHDVSNRMDGRLK